METNITARSAESQTAAGHARQQKASVAYAWYVVLVLMLCYTLSFIDRQILSLLVAPIKRDLSISDTRMGLLQGFAFALFYTFLGLPIGRLADRFSRRNLIASGIFLWSVMTALCSAARSYGFLFLARVGVGVGEAALSPSAFSLIADYFPPERLASAVSVYSMGIFMGSGLALIVGGTIVDSVAHFNTAILPVLGEVTAWRLAFLAIGAPGVLFVLLIYTVREPLRRRLLRAADGQVRNLTLPEVSAQVLLRWQSVAGISVGMVFQSMCTYAFTAWAPAFLQRSYGWTAGQSGRALGIVVLASCCSGMYVGGLLSDRWQRRGVSDAPLRVAVWAAIGTGLFFPPSLMTSSSKISLILFVPALFCMALPIGCIFASLQLILPNQIRGQVSAVLLFVLNLGGLSLGPLLPGVFNDYLFHSEKMLGTSVAITIGLASLLQLIIFPATYRFYVRDYKVMQNLKAS